MRILEYGHIKPHTRFCPHCGCMFEWVPRDVKTLNETHFLNCPVCGKADIVQKEDMED